MSEWSYTLADGTAGTVEADDLVAAIAAAPEGYVTLARIEEPVEASTFTTPDGQKWTLGLTAAGNPKWVKVTA